MGKVNGRIVSAESGVGLKNLLICLSGKGDVTNGVLASLGSTISNREGVFEIDVELGERSDLSSPIELRIAVFAPDRQGSSAQAMFQSKPRLVLPSSNESFFVEIDAETLKGNDIERPETIVDPGRVINFIRANTEHSLAIEKEWTEVARQRVEAKRTAKTEYDKGFRKALLGEISTVPDDLSQPSLLSIDGDPKRTVQKITIQSLQDGTERIAGSSTGAEGTQRRTRYFLTDEQRRHLDELLSAIGGADPIISQAMLETVLRAGEVPENAPTPTSLSREESLFDRFLESTFEERCAQDILVPKAADDDQDADTDTQETQDDADELTKDDINALLGKVTSGIDNPLSQLAGRPGQGDIIGNIRDFSLAPGPADTPAYFDFHKLNLAFDHVWKEFLDERIEPLSQELFMAVKELGGQPERSLASSNSAMEALENEEFLLRMGEVNQPPTALFKQAFRSPHGAQDGLGPGLDVFDPGTVGPDLPDPLPLPPGGGGGGLVGVGTDRPQAPVGGVVKPLPTSLIQILREILRGKYAFTAFGADAKNSAINFGVTVTYRQRWEPVSYQVGELVRTITLAPGETKKYTKRTKLTRKRAEKEIEKNSSILRDEFSTTTRGESEIIRKAQAKTNFSISATGTYNFGIAKGDSTTTTDHDAESASDDTKKSFREAVIKASQEYKQERTLDVSQEDIFETEESESGEISNPNTELTVTYLFFELQRRFRVSEQINKVTPVVLVAQDLPRPNQIDESFLIRFGWILKRALLDDGYAPVISYVAGPMAGDRVAQAALYRAMLDHKAVVEKLKNDLYAMKEQASEGYEALRRAVQGRIDSVQAEESDGMFEDLYESFVGGGENPETARMREEAARNHEQRAVEQVKQLTLALQREISAFAEATDKYTKALKEQKQWELRVVDLLLHIKENILHYMQTIWAYEHPDQRFLRLQMKSAPAFSQTNGGSQYRFLGDLDLTRETVAPDGTVTVRRAVEFAFTPNFEVEQNAKTLAQIADLDTLLGFKGNYMIFPLRESNALTDYMLAPYLDAGFRLLDPDDRGNISREDFARYVCHLSATLDDDTFEELRPALLERFRNLILSGPSNGDEIIVPTGSAYIEALPGANPLLEDFKLAHRALDVLSAQEAARASGLENIRRAARILGEDLADPDIDARYVFEGNASATVVAPPPDDDGPPSGGNNP